MYFEILKNLFILREINEILTTMKQLFLDCLGQMGVVAQWDFHIGQPKTK